MSPRSLILSLLLVAWAVAPAQELRREYGRDMLVTYDNTGARIVSSGVRAPYRNRMRYGIGSDARRDAAEVANDFRLVAVDHWPIDSLGVYCYVYRSPDGAVVEELLAELQADARVESAQMLQQFETGTRSLTGYDDTLANLQHGLATLDIGNAHAHSTGAGVRVAIVDSRADVDHEDLVGRAELVRVFAGDDDAMNAAHGTAVASVIGANANNAKGIVGVAPEASLEVFASCWSEAGASGAVCDSFTLAKALDELLDEPPQILNLSLTGPHDPLLERLIGKISGADVVVVAAAAEGQGEEISFPASLPEVIAVESSERRGTNIGHALYAPGTRIVVAIPENSYDFRSGSSLAAAHISGIVALMLSASPGLENDAISTALWDSQRNSGTVNACEALRLVDNSIHCP